MELRDIQVTVVVGAAHSGTTILYRMLSMHPALTWFSQYSARDGTIPGRFRLPFSDYSDRALRLLLPHSWEKVPASTLPIIPRPGEAHKIWDYIVPRGNEAKIGEARKRAEQVFVHHSRRHGLNHILCKQPRLTLRIGELNAIFPRAKFIHIVRDGRAVAISCRDKFESVGDSVRDRVLAAGRYWEELVETVRNVRDQVKLIEIRYEDYCQAPRETISELLSFVGLSSRSFPFRKIPDELTVTNQQRFAQVSDEIIGQVATELQDLLGIYRYDDLVAPKFNPPEEYPK